MLRDGPISVRVLLLMGGLVMLHTILLPVHLGFILHLSIDLSYSVRHFEISCPHIHSSTTDHCNLCFSDQLLGYGIVKVSNESKASTRLCQRVPDYLALFDLSKLRKVTFKILISQPIIKTANKHFIPDRLIMFPIQFVQFSIMPFPVKGRLRLSISALRPHTILLSIFLLITR
jgi:hypothetical protein